MSEGKVWSHRGDAGDLIAALPVMASQGGGHLRLVQHECTGHRMTRQRVDLLWPLLAVQPYIESVQWADTVEGELMDKGVREQYRNGFNLSDMQCAAFGVPHWPREQPWLVVPQVKRVAKVIFARSPRYWNWSFPWKRVWETYRLDAIFVGTPEEHADFCQGVGPVAYHHTPSYLDLAEVLAGADLVCVNQTSTFWVAEGLKVPVVLEVCTGVQNCHFGRHGMIYGCNEHVSLPAVSDLLDRWAVNMAHRAHEHTVMTDDRLAVIARCVRETEHLPGDMAEVGTYRGGSAKVIASVCPRKKLHVFDTFKGIPEDDVLPGGHHKGEFAADLAEVQGYLAGCNVEYHVGRFPETVKGLENGRYSFVHLDGDLYETTRAAIEYFWPRMVPGGQIVFDDWRWQGCPGVEKAITEAGLAGLAEETAPQQCRISKTCARCGR